ncbi:condensation domain-containing protein [Streptomyces sp. IBSBF 2435]|uniref:condensation domain-containing protein n=1 Tax=Streptomyces sp. IBSBF 2435 TaxID=2903531 RepID=UPI002FDC0E6E
MRGRPAETLGLTGAQRGIWADMAAEPGSPSFNSAEYLELFGDLDVPAFSLALRQVAEEAEALRAGFAETPDGPRQVVRAQAGAPLRTADLRSHADPRREALDRMRDDLGRKVDIAAGPLAGHLLLRLGDRHHIWYQRVHTLLVDAFSLALLTRRTAALYTALTTAGAGRGPAFPPLAELVADEAAYRRSDRFRADRAFWTGQLAAQPRPVLLSAAPPAPASETFLRSSAVLPPGLFRRITRAELDLGTSWPVLVTACAAAYLGAVREAEEVVLGLFSSGRSGIGAAGVPGMISNILPLRLDVRPSGTVGNYAEQVGDAMSRVLRHQRFRQEDMRRHLRATGRPGPLYGPLVNLMPFAREFDFAGVRGFARNLSTGPIDDLSLAVYEARGASGEAGESGEATLVVDIDANPAVYARDEIDGHRDRLTAFLDAFVSAGPSAGLGDVLGAVPP